MCHSPVQWDAQPSDTAVPWQLSCHRQDATCVVTWRVSRDSSVLVTEGCHRMIVYDGSACYATARQCCGQVSVVSPSVVTVGKCRLIACVCQATGACMGMCGWGNRRVRAVGGWGGVGVSTTGSGQCRSDSSLWQQVMSLCWSINFYL